jgi:8-oxo-dGTP pyrophosphatase MutT (NUDIX family)
MAMDWGPDRVDMVAAAVLTVADRPWPYAVAHREAIARHWRLATAANPGFFNGVIHLTETLEIVDGQAVARLVKTDFQSYLYWRDEGFPKAAGMRDGFGSALIRSAEGHMLLGRQRPGNINAGLAYLPGGFIDARDVGPDRTVDLSASVAREVLEETGLGPGELLAEPGFVVTRAGAHVSFAVPYRSMLTSQALAAKIARFIEAEPNPELSDIVIVKGPADLDGLAMPHFARVLLTELLSTG